MNLVRLSLIGSVGFESERDEGVRVVETCTLGFLSAGAPFAALPAHAAEICGLKSATFVGDWDCDVAGDIISALP